jgi:hypothetical protein
MPVSIKSLIFIPVSYILSGFLVVYDRRVILETDTSSWPELKVLPCIKNVFFLFVEQFLVHSKIVRNT